MKVYFAGEPGAHDEAKLIRLKVVHRLLTYYPKSYALKNVKLWRPNVVR